MTIDIVFRRAPAGPDLTLVEVERNGKSIRIGEWSDRGPYSILTLPDPERKPEKKPKADPMDLQRAEFDAADEFAKQVRRIQLTAIVDDGYPSVRHDYEGALRRLISALRDNGRIL